MTTQTGIKVPDNRIVAVPYTPEFKGRQDEIFFNFNGMVNRSWFVEHAYRCLPLVMGNQHGFGVKSLYDFSVWWNGGEKTDDVKVAVHDEEYYLQNSNLQSIKPHFGMGTITLQTAFSLRTPPNVSLITIDPPNVINDGLRNMMGVIETDNLRRDFTFNLRITRPNSLVTVKKGDIIAAVMPYPRLFIDNYKLVAPEEVFTEEEIKGEQEAARLFGVERSQEDVKKPHGVGRRYHRGEDIYGNKFKYPHQRNLRPPKNVKEGGE